MVGYVVKDAYEEIIDDSKNQFSDLTITDEYSISNFSKRYGIKWIGSFSREDADAKIYKMINTHHAITNINDYKPFINRALFDCYEESSKLHITFQIYKRNDMATVPLVSFLKSLVDFANDDTSQPNNVLLKTNVQSPGIIEIIRDAADAGFILLDTLSNFK